MKNKYIYELVWLKFLEYLKKNPTSTAKLYKYYKNYFSIYKLVTHSSDKIQNKIITYDINYDI